ncbi:hypothetical protein BN874_2730005 [Candidatus Contendobacter odensis Run_B_J11]|uniref:Uncharacterized protein n=1 Tax=Candidatus Contendobacter odensis Run_B_J11 TaxID=1400861 RepID=A0A7U7J4W8_9GAMM|nr:hypothetical protein BN874_2730005 [Candidatus Contendobacter odensis Run_B_J11]
MYSTRPASITPVSGSTSMVLGSGTYLRQTAMRMGGFFLAGSGRLGFPEGDAITAVRVTPADRAFLIAGDITGAALETLFVVEQNAAVVQRDEQVGRTDIDAGMNRTLAAADFRVDDDVRGRRHPEAHCAHFFFVGGHHHKKALAA